MPKKTDTGWRRKWASARARVVLQERPCEECWGTFTPSRSNCEKYCSVECKEKVIKRRRAKWNEDHKEDWQKSSFYRLRFEVFKRDNFTCQYCGRTAQDGAKLHADHITPKSKGGELNMDNLVTSCKECNLGKRDAVLTEHQEAKLKNR